VCAQARTPCAWVPWRETLTFRRARCLKHRLYKRNCIVARCVLCILRSRGVAFCTRDNGLNNVIVHELYNIVRRHETINNWWIFLFITHTHEYQTIKIWTIRTHGSKYKNRRHVLAYVNKRNTRWVITKMWQRIFHPSKHWLSSRSLCETSTV